MKNKGPVANFIINNYKHFNAATLVDAAQAYEEQLEKGNKMMITMAGAMSTAELGISLAEMIRQDKVHIITCTGANLEEDVFNLVAHDFYKRVPNYRDLSPYDEEELLKNNFNRVTDTCIPEEEAMRRIETHLVEAWVEAKEKNEKYFPHEYFYKILKSEKLKNDYQIDPKNSWLLAAAEKNLPIIVPGWEDSTCGNFFASHCIENRINTGILKGGIDYMIFLADWYQKNAGQNGVGFFQIGGGIAGDFPICVVPMLHQDLELEDVPVWSYFCQISDSTTSYGSYSGAVPNEKITWGKLRANSPKFVIESDATIVAPLIFAYLLGL
jgi:deoxyhypusine synthase